MIKYYYEIDGAKKGAIKQLFPDIKDCDSLVIEETYNRFIINYNQVEKTIVLIKTNYLEIKFLIKDVCDLLTKLNVEKDIIDFVFFYHQNANGVSFLKDNYGEMIDKTNEALSLYQSEIIDFFLNYEKDNYYLILGNVNSTLYDYNQFKELLLNTKSQQKSLHLGKLRFNPYKREEDEYYQKICCLRSGLLKGVNR